jgi:hypothetical protein
MKIADVLVAALVIFVGADRAMAQPFVVEADVTGGYSTDEAGALATQLRAFGETLHGLRLFSEVAWAGRRQEEGVTTDAFGAAYPYGNRVQVIEAYAERLFRPGAALVGFRAGRYRTPFGIYARSDYAYTGFLRAPLLRYDGYFALSNNFLEHGAELIAGIPKLYVETSLSTPADVGESRRRSGLNSVTRLQGYHGPWIVGVSWISTQPYFPERFASGRSVFTGLDLRWMQSGVQILAEWMHGRPFDGTATDGWHADLIVHRPFMGPVTAMWRSEQLDYDAAPPRQRSATRHTAGARIRLFRNFAAQANVLHQTGDLSESYATAFDVALTYSLRSR